MSEGGAPVVAITGAASGMGKATAELFAERGATVELIDIAETVSAVASSIGANNAYVGDIADSGFCTRTIDAVVAEHGRCLLYTSPSPRDS